MEIIILEDDKNYASLLEKQLQMIDSSFLIKRYYSIKSFNQDFSQFNDYTIFILDIILSDGDGIELAKKINNTITGAAIIFVTGFINRASDIYDAEHCYFIYKPDLSKRLPLAIDKACELIKKSKNYITIINRGKTFVILLDEIIFIERNLRKSIIHLNEKVYDNYDDFKSYQQKLTNNFYGCHRSFIVNFDKVQEHQRNHFVMNNGAVIPISRSHEKEAKKAFHNYLINQL